MNLCEKALIPWNLMLPVDPFGIAKAHGFEVIFVESGFFINDTILQISLYNSKRIFILKNSHRNRQRFAVAHALGHYFLGHINNASNLTVFDSVKNFSLDEKDKKELDANRFALDFLMPKEAISSLVEKAGVTDLVRLANIFDISEAAMECQLRRIGWIY